MIDQLSLIILISSLPVSNDFVALSFRTSSFSLPLSLLLILVISSTFKYLAECLYAKRFSRFYNIMTICPLLNSLSYIPSILSS